MVPHTLGKSILNKISSFIFLDSSKEISDLEQRLMQVIVAFNFLKTSPPPYLV
jgi:hypothetical protein